MWIQVPNQADIAWAAGLFEGEGSASGSLKRGASASLAMTDEESVRRFADVLGFGKVHGPYQPTNSEHSPFWDWRTANRAGVKTVLDLLGSWLSKRRRAQLRAAGEGPCRRTEASRQVEQIRLLHSLSPLFPQH